MLRTTLSILMAERGERQDEISKVTGISKATLSNIANNKTAGIQYENLEALAIYFNVSIGDLFDFSPYKFTPILYRDPSSTPAPNSDEELHVSFDQFNPLYPDKKMSDDEFYLFGAKIDILKPNFKHSTIPMYLHKYNDINDGQTYLDVQADGDFYEILMNLPIVFKKDVQHGVSEFIEKNFKEVLNTKNVSGRVSVIFDRIDEIFINV